MFSPNAFSSDTSRGSTHIARRNSVNVEIMLISIVISSNI